MRFLLGWLIVTAVLACTDASVSHRESGLVLAGHFGGNAFSRDAVTGPAVQMARRPDGSWGGMFPCRPFLGHPSQQMCPLTLEERADGLTVNGALAFSLTRSRRSVLLRRPPLDYEFMTLVDRAFPPELVAPLFLAITSSKDPGQEVAISAHAEGRLSLFDNQAILGWIVEVEGLGQVAVRRGPSP